MTSVRARQSRMMSFAESLANVAVGFLVGLATQVILFPRVGLVVTVGDNLLIAAVFTVVSMLRSFTLRRLFECIRTRKRTSGPKFYARREAQRSPS